jgi:CBS domain-containing membrane protein
VLTDAVLLVLTGVLINSATGRRYPSRPAAPMPDTDAPRFSAADLDAALVHYNQVIDVSRDDLESLLHYAEAQAFGRRLGDLRCGQVMTHQVVTADYAMPLHEAWLLLREHRIKALPVIDAAGRVLGIVTVADFLRHADLDAHEGVGGRLRAFLRASATVTADKPEVVGQIMRRQVRVARAERAVTELLPLFSDSGHHHIPIIDASHRLVGILTQSDLVKALHQAIR